MLVNYHKQRKTLREVFDKVCQARIQCQVRISPPFAIYFPRQVDKPELLADVMEHGPVVGIDGIAEDGSVVVIGIPGVIGLLLYTKEKG